MLGSDGSVNVFIAGIANCRVRSGQLNGKHSYKVIFIILESKLHQGLIQPRLVVVSVMGFVWVIENWVIFPFTPMPLGVTEHEGFVHEVCVLAVPEGLTNITLVERWCVNACRLFCLLPFHVQNHVLSALGLTFLLSSYLKCLICLCHRILAWLISATQTRPLFWNTLVPHSCFPSSLCRVQRMQML